MVNQRPLMDYHEFQGSVFAFLLPFFYLKLERRPIVWSRHFRSVHLAALDLCKEFAASQCALLKSSIRLRLDGAARLTQAFCFACDAIAEQ